MYKWSLQCIKFGICFHYYLRCSDRTKHTNEQLGPVVKNPYLNILIFISRKDFLFQMYSLFWFYFFNQHTSSVNLSILLQFTKIMQIMLFTKFIFLPELLKLHQRTRKPSMNWPVKYQMHVNYWKYLWRSEKLCYLNTQLK